MKYVAFKTYGMMGNKKYPSAYPALCHEFNREDNEPVPAKYDGYIILGEIGFSNYQDVMTKLYAEDVAKANLTKRPWYKFFSK